MLASRAEPRATAQGQHAGAEERLREMSALSNRSEQHRPQHLAAGAL